MNEGTLPKKDILDTLKTFKKTLTGTETITGYDYGIIYYTGHGCRGTGNWAAADNENVSLKEVAKIFKSIIKSGYKSVTIISDCCFSGMWTDRQVI